MKVVNTQVNHVSRPMGYYMPYVTFQWKVEADKGTRQTEAAIKIAMDEAMIQVVYDTGFSAENSALGTRVDFVPEAKTRYYYTISAKTDAGEEAVSEADWFETGIAEDTWEAQWITCDMDEERIPLFIREFSPRSEVTSARLYICGLGAYVARIVDADDRITWLQDEYLAPYCNDFESWNQYQTYDITQGCKTAGRLEVAVGKGWNMSRFGFMAKDEVGTYGSEYKLIAQLEIKYADGSVEVIPSDNRWHVGRTNITFATIYDGQHTDDTLSPTTMLEASCCDAPQGKLMGRLSTPVKARELLQPTAIIKTPKGETVLDMGQEITGTFRLHVRASAGEIIHIQTGETLQNGCFYNDNLRSAKSEYIYVSDGISKVVEPRFTFFGYRYVKIEGMDDITVDDFTGVCLYSEIPERLIIQTGHELVNKLISNVRWSMKDNFLDVPTDCPQRDERLGWTGDAQVFSPTAMYLADTYAFYRKYLYDIACEQSHNDGMVPNIVPSFKWNTTSSVWGDVSTILPWNLYRYYGDEQILMDQFDSMCAWVDYIGKVDGDTHNWGQVFHFGDWLALDNPSGAIDEFLGGTDEDYIANIYYMNSLEILVKAAKIIENKAAVDKYYALATRQRAYIKKEYFTISGRCAVKTQTGLILALHFGLSDNVELIANQFATLFERCGKKLKTGFVGTPLLAPTLSENGFDEYAFHLLLNEEYPGWLREVKLGATTIWERWNTLDDDGRITSTGMNSMNHYSYGSILEWLVSYVAGIGITEDCIGASEILYRPGYNRQLGHLNCCYDSAVGRYESHWKILHENYVYVKLVVPFGGSAQVQLAKIPYETMADKSNPLFADVRDGIAHVGPGTYEVTYETTEAFDNPD